jgi:ribosome biogenesis GTPase / thiamine phosphate phosphatase
VHSDELDDDLLCTPRGRLKKERVSVVTGDKVEIDEIDATTRTGVIVKRHDRMNKLSRPVIANVDTPVIVQAAHQPEWNPLLCDRYIIHVLLELELTTPIICINKCDLATVEEEKKIKAIYEPLGYSVLFISASTGLGIDALTKALSGKVAVLLGPSGVGKSSIINLLDPGLGLRIGVMENDFGVGRSTTTYSALYPIKIKKGGKASWVADTPGFSLSELRHSEPSQLQMDFPEIVELAKDCKFADCLHLNEQGCNVLEHLVDIAESRYRSYGTMLAESIKQHELQRTRSHKIEQNVKTVGKKSIPRLERKYRIESRRSAKQTLIDVEIEKEDA